jgi:hypothetical protein
LFVFFFFFFFFSFLTPVVRYLHPHSLSVLSSCEDIDQCKREGRWGVWIDSGGYSDFIRDGEQEVS